MEDMQSAARQTHGVFVKLLWGLTAVCSVIGGLLAAIGVASAKGAPQECAAAAIGLAMAAIPYCLARAVSKLRQ